VQLSQEANSFQTICCESMHGTGVMHLKILVLRNLQNM